MDCNYCHSYGVVYHQAGEDDYTKDICDECEGTGKYIWFNKDYEKLDSKLEKIKELI